MKEFRGFIIFSLLAIGYFCLPYYLMYFHPVENIFFLGENSWIEDSTFFAWFLSFCLISGLIIRDRQYRRIGYYVIAIGCFFVSMEEISWGQNLLHYSVPDFFKQVNRQGEVTLHNLINFPTLLVIIGLIIWSTLFPIISSRNNRIKDVGFRLGVPIVPLMIRPFFWLGALVNLNFIDYSITVSKADEWEELFLGYAILVFVFDIILKRLNLYKRFSLSYLMAPFVSILLIISITALNQRLRGTEMEIRSAYLVPIFCEYFYPDKGMYKQAKEVYQYALKQKHLKNKINRIRYAELLQLLGFTSESKEILDIALKENTAAQQDTNDTHTRMVAYLNIAKIKNLEEYHIEAEKALEEALKIGYKEIESNKENFEIYFLLGKIYFEKGNYIKSIENLELAKKVALNEECRTIIERWRQREFRKLESQNKFIKK